MGNKEHGDFLGKWVVSRNGPCTTTWFYYGGHVINLGMYIDKGWDGWETVEQVVEIMATRTYVVKDKGETEEKA